MEQNKQLIYIMRNGNTNLYKIGISQHCNKRKKQLQTGNPNEIKLLYRCYIDPEIKAVNVETTIHQYLKENNKWIRGEWFRLTETEVYSIAKLLLVVGRNALSL